MVWDWACRFAGRLWNRMAASFSLMATQRGQGSVSPLRPQRHRKTYRMNVALIDDDAAVLDSLGMLLRNRGIAVECFTSVADFLARFESMSLTCVVSDVRMPGLSGLDLQSELLKRRNSVPLILITGRGDIA